MDIVPEPIIQKQLDAVNFWEDKNTMGEVGLQ